jgi:hypothetical protein
MDNWWSPFIAPIVYAMMIIYLVWETRRNGINDKFPCIIVKGRERRKEQRDEGLKRWGVRLINIGRGPAFIDDLNVQGLTEYSQGSQGPLNKVNGNRTHNIDKVIGPDVGDPDLQMEFAGQEDILILQRSDVTIEVKYHDITGRNFMSGIRKGVPFWEPPDDFKYGILDRLRNRICGCK